jgi:hypothetical protein
MNYSSTPIPKTAVTSIMSDLGSLQTMPIGKQPEVSLAATLVGGT